MLPRVSPGPGEESVWDYPRPPRLEPTSRRLRVVFHGETVAETRRGQRVLETSHPPVYYFPREDVAMKLLHEVDGTSYCEWKGSAGYYDVVVGARRAARAAFDYPSPTAAFELIRNHIAFYAEPFECSVDGNPVEPQPGGFYAGWITPELVGPFKGGPGSMGW